MARNHDDLITITMVFNNVKKIKSLIEPKWLIKDFVVVGITQAHKMRRYFI